MHGSILLIEDEPGIRTLVHELFSEDGYPIITLDNATTGLAFVQRFQPRVIIIDLLLPIMNGFEFIEAYQRLPGPHAPIVILTASMQPDQVARAQALSDAFIHKPFNIDVLFETVVNLFNRAD